MKMIRNSLFFLLLFTFSAYSQENDFQTWSSFSLNKKIESFKKTTFSLKMGLRLRENSSLYSKSFVDLKLKRKFNKRISYALGYRYIDRRDITMDFSTQDRFYADLSYNNKLSKRLNYAVRNRWQNQGASYDYEMTFRQKVSLKYNIPKTKLTPSIGSEYFLPLKDTRINKLRSTFSISYPLIKDLDIELAYRIQQEFYVNNPQTLFIFEGRLAYDL